MYNIHVYKKIHCILNYMYIFTLAVWITPDILKRKTLKKHPIFLKTIIFDLISKISFTTKNFKKNCF